MATTTTADRDSDLSAEQQVPTSRDFRFLWRLDPLLAEYTERGAEFSAEHPEECLVNIRKFAEYVVIYLEHAAQISNANTASNGGNEKGEVVYEKFRLRVDRFKQIPPQVRAAVKDIWFRCGDKGAHPPHEFLLNEKDIEDHKEELREVVVPALKNARLVANWIRQECGNKQSVWPWIKWTFFRRRIGLKQQLSGLTV
jgi:hypothetical protein